MGMPTTKILVVANRTADARTLLEDLERRAAGREVELTLLVPVAARGREEARERLDAALGHLRATGVRARGLLGAEDPAVAVEEEYEDARYDEIVVATLARGHSSWLASGLPARVEHLTHAVVHHVPVPAGEAAPPLGPPAEPQGLLEGFIRELHVDTNTDTGPLRG